VEKPDLNGINIEREFIVYLSEGHPSKRVTHIIPLVSTDITLGSRGDIWSTHTTAASLQRPAQASAPAAWYCWRHIRYYNEHQDWTSVGAELQNCFFVVTRRNESNIPKVKGIKVVTKQQIIKYIVHVAAQL